METAAHPRFCSSHDHLVQFLVIRHLSVPLGTGVVKTFRYATKSIPIVTALKHQTYGCGDADLDALAPKVALQLALDLQPHTSSYIGDYYLDHSRRFAECRLYRNVDPLFQSDNDPPEDYWFEPDYPQHHVLLNVDGVPDSVHELHHLTVTSFPEFVLINTSSVGDA